MWQMVIDQDQLSQFCKQPLIIANASLSRSLPKHSQGQGGYNIIK
jgi:hypothetical protein